MAISTNTVGLSSVFAAVTEKVMHSNSKRELESLVNEFSALINKVAEIQERDPQVFPKKKCIYGTIQFQKKECAKMEESFKKEFLHNNRVARITKYDNEDGTYRYDIRYISNTYRLFVSSSDLKEAKLKFIEETKSQNIKIGA